MGGTRPSGPHGVETRDPGPVGMARGPAGLAEMPEPRPPGDTPGPVGTEGDHAAWETEIVAAVPTGVRDARTAIAYARTRRTFRSFAGLSNQDLAAEARFLDRFLRGRCADFGPEAQSEIARLLIAMEAEMARRLREAPLDEHGLPAVDGVTWDPDDPVAGITEAISPFGMLDVWTSYLREPLPEPPRRRRRVRRREVVVEEGESIVVVRQRPPEEAVITGVRLDVRHGSFAAWFLRHYSNAILTGGSFNPNPSYITGTASVTRYAFAPPLEAEWAELRRIYLDDDTHQYGTDDIRYFHRMKRELQRVVDAWVPYFREAGRGEHQGERRSDLLNTREYRAFRQVVLTMGPPEIDLPSDVAAAMSRPNPFPQQWF